jgi:hypothetical protein
MLTTAQGPMAGKPVVEKKARTAKSALQCTASATGIPKSRSTKNPAHTPTPAPLPVPKPLPKALWTPVRTHLSLQGAEARIYIREFALRFLPLSRSQHDELEVLSRSRRDFDEDDDEDGDLEPWVSEGCVKALLIALLGMIEVDAKVCYSLLRPLLFPDYYGSPNRFFPQQPTRSINRRSSLRLLIP